MNEIIDILPYSEKTVRVRIQNANIAVKAQPGNFVIIKFSEDGQRIPFSIVATDPELGLIDIIIHRGDGLDNILVILRRSQHLPDLLGPLGIAADIPSGKRLLFCGDGSGFVPLLPLMRTARTRGCHVAAIVSEFSSQMHCLLPEISASSDEVLRAEEDTFLLIASRMMYEGKVDKVIMSGPTLMMKHQKWLMEHSWEYGFILRYPSGKSDVTGIIYEPWHYRYVGKDAAAEIYERGVCLEEYLAGE